MLSFAANNQEKVGRIIDEQNIFPSGVGNVVDVATRSRIGLSFSIIWRFLFQFPLISIPFVMAAAVYNSAVSGNNASFPWWGIALASIPATFLCWAWGTTPVRRLRGYNEKDLYLRAGPGGISMRIPGEGTLSSLGFGYKILQYDIVWADIHSWYPYTIRVNGIPVEKTIVIEGVDGWRIDIPLLYFSESRDTIVSNITQASRLEQLADTGQAGPSGI